MNDAARRALGAGSPLAVKDGFLSARRRNDQRRLAAYIEAAILGEPGPANLAVGEGPHEAIALTVCRLPSVQTMDGLFTGPPEGWVAMVVFEPAPPVRSALGPLQDLGLSLAEARTAVALAEGYSPAQYATAMGVSINTVRTHLSRLRRKLDCGTQAEVVRRVLHLLPRAR